MTEKEKKAVESLNKLVQLRKNKTNTIKYDSCICSTKELDIALNLIQKQQEENKKKDKIIDEMAECIGQDIRCVRPEIECNKMTHNCKECVKQYFENKIESKQYFE